MASALVVLHPVWTGLAVAPFGQSLPIPAQGISRAGPAPGRVAPSPRQSPGAVGMCHWGGFSPIALLTGSF